MSDAPIIQTARTPISEWSDTNNLIVEQSKVIKNAYYIMIWKEFFL